MLKTPRRPWVPIYVADYIADTTHLSTTEHGAYFLLILDYWRNGGLPSDKDQLARIARMTPKEWARISPTIKGFFGPNWQHKRLDAEIERAIEISRIKRQNVGRRRDRGATNVATDVGSIDQGFEDTLHTSHFTQGPVHDDEGSVRGSSRGTPRANGSRFGREKEADFTREADDVFSAGGMA